MTHAAPLLALLFLAITFLQSAQYKLFNWSDNRSWLTGHFEKTIIKNLVPQSLFLLTVLELIAGFLCLAGMAQLYFYKTNTLGFYGAVVSCISLLMMLLGQRLAKDYEGAKTIAIYFIPAVLLVHWLS